jgi:hypothetical protein
MSFKEAACHVWAIDGYESDERSVLVNNAFSTITQGMVGGGSSSRPKKLKMDTDGIVKSIVEEVRRKTKTKVSSQECTVYGGCRDSQIPEHWWIEVGDRIYDTMPGYVLFSVPASEQTRCQPFMERDPFEKREVGQFKTKLTLTQQEFISENDPVAAPHVGLNAGVTIEKAAKAAEAIQQVFRAHLKR